jgi:TIR domain
MRVFISWSGDASHRLALTLRDWLPNVLQAIDPYVSSVDIDKGARWSTEIATELAQCDFGLICVSPDNAAAPWLNFEAGALSKSLDTARVVPLLFRMRRSDLSSGPLVQFQSSLVEKDEILQIVVALNGALQERALPEDRLVRGFETWWPNLKEALEAIHDPQNGPAPRRDQPEMLEELLELARAQQRAIAELPHLLTPEPGDRSAFALRAREEVETNRLVLMDIVSGWREIERLLGGTAIRGDDPLGAAVRRLDRAVRYLEEILPLSAQRVRRLRAREESMSRRASNLQDDSLSGLQFGSDEGFRIPLTPDD